MSIFNNNVVYPVSSDDNGINIKPELMEKEKLYHYVFNNKVLLLFKDSQDFLNCYEIEEENWIDISLKEILILSLSGFKKLCANVNPSPDSLNGEVISDSSIKSGTT